MWQFMYNCKKNLTKLTYMIAFVPVAVTGCDAFLEPDPKSFSSTVDYYQVPGHFDAALNSVYAQLRSSLALTAGSFTSTFMNWMEVRMDAVNRHYNVNLPGGQRIIEWLPTASDGGGTWNSLYHTIAQANVVLDRIEGVSFPNETQKNQIVGEAKFLRALSYWYLVQFYGNEDGLGVPLVLHEISSPANAIPEGGRATTTAVYEQIVADLQDAIQLLPANAPQPGRASQGAAKFLLGRTHLLTRNYNAAVTVLGEVESNYGYRLLPDYRSVFDPANENNAESIFEIQYGTGIAGQPHNELASHLLPWNSRGIILGNHVAAHGNYHPSFELVEMYQPGDRRYAASIQWWHRPGNSQYPEVAIRGDSISIIRKFLWPEHINNLGQQNGNWIVFRYADVLLSLAEAHWRLGNDGQAVAYLNRVRNRAGLPNLDLTNIPENKMLAGTSMAGDPVARALFTERTLELFAEGHRMFDLLRFGRDVAYQVMVNYVSSRKTREPRIVNSYVVDRYELNMGIPPEDVNNSNGLIVQNPGYTSE